MPLHILHPHSTDFPPPEAADEDGLLAVGGDLSPARLWAAYQQGIFPWFNAEEPPLWWSPDPRFVLFPSEVRVSKSMDRWLRKERYDFHTNTAFEDVVRACAAAPRPGQDGTWITSGILRGYTALHAAGRAHSAEVWMDGELAGGLYGVRVGRVFCGESMFARRANASKAAFILYVRQLFEEGVTLIDCQVPTEHLASLGARPVPRSQFLQILREGLESAA